MTQYFHYPYQLQLESGEQLNQIKVAYQQFGNPGANKTIWVCHALTGNTQLNEWWPGLFAENGLFNTTEYRIICANVLGSCYGTTGPNDLPVPLDFPLITIRDMVEVHDLLLQHLKITKIDILIGASLGGQQALEWAVSKPKLIVNLILIASNAEHSAYGKACNEAQRLALLADETFGRKGGGKAGLKTARAVAMLSYRSYADFKIKQEDVDTRIADYKAASYVAYQGDKFTKRFDPYAYYTLTKSMDSHCIGRGRNGNVNALESVKANSLVVGIESDVLFPIEEQQYLAKHIPNADFGIINSVHGHDGFLIEYDQLNQLINEFLYHGFKSYKPTTLKHKTNVN
ncbi:MAG: homoserine O-acetyltransferase [Crocinitomix sp.]|nr:homoserine O-acetyltransferase [Crocinitomix sp.]